ncbi:MAG: rod shape-determining protein MreC [Campylobacterota bacterium]|nr:rod shape-determining protein MreC [Campylobacterota bacterium]
MNRKLSSFLLIFAILLSFALNYNSALQKPIISYLNSIKYFYHNTITTINETINQHFYQRDNIIQLQKKLKLYEKNHLISHQIASELNRLYQENNATFNANPNVELAQGLSYVTLGDMNKLWLHMNDFNSSKIYGLVYKEHSAGIVISKNSQPLALLNSDPKCTYAVSIGSNRVPGIIHGTNQEEMYVEFIPSWMKIKVGDEVHTSGLDNLFFSNILVGRVTAISQAQGYQNATVLPYFKDREAGYFHVIKNIR